MRSWDNPIRFIFYRVIGLRAKGEEPLARRETLDFIVRSLSGFQARRFDVGKIASKIRKVGESTNRCTRSRITTIRVKRVDRVDFPRGSRRRNRGSRRLGHWSLLCSARRINIWNVTGSFMVTPSLPPLRIIYRIRVGVYRLATHRQPASRVAFPFSEIRFPALPP